MRLRELIDGASCLNLRALMLALRHPSKLRSYLGHCLKRYDEAAGHGLPCAAPITPPYNLAFSLPGAHPGGGMNFDEMVVLGRTTKALNPKAIFEIGSYNGLSTAIFLLNSSQNTKVFSLDLPEEVNASDAAISADKELISSRTLGRMPRELGLRPYKQILCDSMTFDPSPYANSIDLALIDGAHDAVHVENDTRKVTKMLSDNSVVFWHDYGGKGDLRPLAAYLENLAKKCPLFRIPGTSLAWGRGKELKSAVS